MDYKSEFLEKSILGREINLDNAEEVMRRCISLRYKDMNVAARFCITNKVRKECNIKSKEEICDEVYNLLKKNNWNFSRDIIKEVSKIIYSDEKIINKKRYVTTYGLAQKIVNMSFKYFYVFNSHIAENIKIEYANCDCPLDSIILGKAEIDNCIWSKLTEEEYIYCQNKISGLLDARNERSQNIGNLEFDFLNW